MEYGLIFTIYGIVFMILLFLSVNLKRMKSSIRSTLYNLLISASIALAVLESLAVFVLVYDSNLFNLFIIVWNLRNVALFFYLYIFVLYYIELVKPTNKYSVFKDYFFKNKGVLFSCIILLLFSIVYVLMIVPNNYSDGVFIFFGGKSTSTFIVIGAFIATSVIALTFKFRHTRKNLLQCMVLVVFLLVIIFPFQIHFKTTSLIPFALMFILYMFYYNIENPDIELLEEVRNLKNNIDKSSNTKSDFLFNLSYDLINPINTIVSLSDSVCNMQVLNKEEIINDIKSIKLAGNTLLDSIDNVLDMSNDNTNILLKEYSLYEIICRMKGLCESRIGSKQIKFELSVDNNLYSKYIGDVNNIQKILMNVLGNAVKFTDVGKVKMTITSSIEDNKNILHFRISDSGRGIKEEEKPFIFNDKAENSGVGLAYSKKLILQMGGSIRFESTYGGGTSFYIDIPQNPSGSRLISEDMTNNDINTFDYVDFSNFKVLIVDDDNLDIKVVKRLLEKYKLQIEVCNSSVKFIDMMKSEYVCDIVFLDHKMPEIDGVEAIDVIRRLEGYNMPKMVCLTANASLNAREYYKSVGFDEYLSKPIDVHELNSILKKFLIK